MRKNRSFLVVVASLLVLFAFAACDAGVYFPAAIVSAEINQTSDMLNGQDYDPSLFNVVATLNDKSTTTLKGIVEWKGTESEGVQMGDALSANAGRDWYGKDFVVEGVLKAYDVIGLEITGPATVNTADTDSVSISAEDLTVKAKYSVDGVVKTKTLAPVADYTVGAATVSDLSADNPDVKTSVEVTLTFQTANENAKGTYEFTAHYTGDYTDPVAATYEWDGDKLAYTVAEGTYFERGLFGDGTEIVTLYKVLDGKDETGAAVTGAMRFEEITDDVTLSISALDGTSGDETRFAAGVSSTVAASYTYVVGGKYATADNVIGKVTLGEEDEFGLTGTVAASSSTITIALEPDYIKAMDVELADEEKVFYVGDTYTKGDFAVTATWASGYVQKLQNSDFANFPGTTANLGTVLTITYTGSDNSYADYVDGINSVEYELEVLDYPQTVTATLKENVTVYTGQKYSADMFDFTAVWKSGTEYEDGQAPEVVYTLNTPAEAGSSRENVWFSWSCNGQESAAQAIRATVTPKTDYPVSITAPATISGGFPLEYHDADFNFAVTWASGLTYNEDTTATAPTIDYKYAYAYMENQESVIVSAAGNHTVSITWTCGEAASEEPIIVTISATAPEV